MKKLKHTKWAELNQAYLKVLHWFFSYPDKEMSLNDLSENLEISKTTAKKIVETLIGEDFLKREILGKTWRIYCNISHPYNYSRKVSYNLTLIYESKIINAIKEIYKNPKAIILFGSYRKGDDNEKSDIDIAIEITGNQDVKIEKFARIPKIGYRKNIQINLYIFSRNKIDLNMFSNIANGIVIEGFLEVKP